MITFSEASEGYHFCHAHGRRTAPCVNVCLRHGRTTAWPAEPGRYVCRHRATHCLRLYVFDVGAVRPVDNRQRQFYYRLEKTK